MPSTITKSHCSTHFPRKQSADVEEGESVVSLGHRTQHNTPCCLLCTFPALRKSLCVLLRTVYSDQLSCFSFLTSPAAAVFPLMLFSSFVPRSIRIEGDTDRDAQSEMEVDALLESFVNTAIQCSKAICRVIKG